MYSDFMLMLLDILEPRLFESDTVLFTENVPLFEQFFITRGKIMVGYREVLVGSQRELFQKSELEVLCHMHPGHCVGSEMILDMIPVFLYKSLDPIECFSIRKSNWRLIEMH